MAPFLAVHLSAAIAFCLSGTGVRANTLRRARRTRDIIALDSGGFSEFVKTHKVVVEFMEPWCPHCKAFKPVWDDVGTSVNASQLELVVATVDCDVDLELCKKQGVKYVPDLQYYNGDDSNKPTDVYAGTDYTATDIVHWLQSKAMKQFAQQGGHSDVFFPHRDMDKDHQCKIDGNAN